MNDYNFGEFVKEYGTENAANYFGKMCLEHITNGNYRFIDHLLKLKLDLEKLDENTSKIVDEYINQALNILSAMIKCGEYPPEALKIMKFIESLKERYPEHRDYLSNILKVNGIGPHTMKEIMRNIDCSNIVTKLGRRKIENFLKIDEIEKYIDSRVNKFRYYIDLIKEGNLCYIGAAEQILCKLEKRLENIKLPETFKYFSIELNNDSFLSKLYDELILAEKDGRVKNKRKYERIDGDELTGVIKLPPHTDKFVMNFKKVLEKITSMFPQEGDLADSYFVLKVVAMELAKRTGRLGEIENPDKLEEFVEMLRYAIKYGDKFDIDSYAAENFKHIFA